MRLNNYSCCYWLATLVIKHFFNSFFSLVVRNLETLFMWQSIELTTGLPGRPFLYTFPANVSCFSRRLEVVCSVTISHFLRRLQDVFNTSSPCLHQDDVCWVTCYIGGVPTFVVFKLLDCRRNISVVLLIIFVRSCVGSYCRIACFGENYIISKLNENSFIMVFSAFKLLFQGKVCLRFRISTLLLSIASMNELMV